MTTDSICYHFDVTDSNAAIKSDLVTVGARAAALREQARRITLDAITEASGAGLSQRAIGRAIGRSQPEVSRLLKLAPTRFVSRSELGRLLIEHRAAILQAVCDAGASNVRVFGSVARGEDGPRSDIDLLIDIPSPFSMIDLARLQRELSRLVGRHVDVIPARGLKGKVGESALKDARSL